MSYLLKGAEASDFETIHATHPAMPNTYVCYAFKDGTIHKDPVVLWAVLSNGVPEPITLDGVWGGTAHQANMFLQFPDGRCGRYDQSWPNEDEAVAALKQFDRSNDE